LLPVTFFDVCGLISLTHTAYTVKVSEVNRKSPPRYITVKLSTIYTEPERNNTDCIRQTDGQTTVSCQ